MSDETVTHRLSTEGVDLLTLAGVNDGNLIELSRLTGAKISLRGDALTMNARGDRGAGRIARTAHDRSGQAANT